MTNYVKEYMGHKVPEGAAYFNPANECFYNQDKTRYSYTGDNFGWDDVDNFDCARNATELPQEPESKEWVDGLPPIGCECLLDDEEGYLFSAADNEKVRIVADEVLIVISIGFRHDNNGKVATVMAKDSRNLKGYTTVNPEFLSPLKTEKEKEREAFIEWGKKGLSYRLEEQSFAIRIIEQLADNGAKAPEGE